MAVNKKGGKNPNTIEETDDFGLADLGRIEQQYANEPAVFREMRLRAKTANRQIAAVNAVEAAFPGSVADPEQPWAKMLSDSNKSLRSLQPRMALYKESTRERLNEQAVNIVSRDYSERAINSYITANSNNLSAQVAGANKAWQGYSNLAEQRENIMNKMQGLRQDSMQAASSYITNHGVSKDASSTIKDNAGQMKELAQQLIPITLAMQQLKQQGLDPQGRQRHLINVGDKASSLLNSNRLENEMASKQGLGALNPAELKKKEAEAAEKLIKALEELRNSAGKTKDELEDLNKNAEQAAKEFEEVSEARGMPGSGDKYAKEKIVAGTVAEALAVITSAFQNVMINQPMQMVSNVASAANLENEKYGMWHDAAAGDMTARMTLGAWQTGHEFGNQQADRKDFVHGGRVISHGIAGVLGVAQIGTAVAGTAGTVIGNNVIENAAQGAKSAISGAAGVVEEGAAWNRQIEKTQLRVDGTRAVVNAAKAVNHISGQQMQQYRTYVMGLNEAAGQMGGAVGENFLNEAGSTQFLERMEKVGIGVKEMGALSAQGANAMGSMFNKEQVFQSARLETLGFGDANQNMRRMGILGAAGTQDPGQNLAKLIEEAMQRGLNSSKAIDMIVENTARMTEETAMAGGGADPTEFLTKSILSALDKTNPNKELAGQIAYQTYQSNEGARHNIATSFPGIINVDRNMKDMGLGTDRMSAALLTQIPTAMLNAYKGKSESELKEFFEGRGIQTKNMDQSLFKDGKVIDILNKNASVAELAQQTGVGYATGSPGALLEEMLKNKDNKEVTSAFLTGKNLNVLSEEQRKLRMGVAGGLALNGKNVNATLSNAFVLAGGTIDGETQKTLAEMDAESENSTRGAATREKRLGNRAQTGQAVQGGKHLEADAGGAQGIKTLAETGRKAFEKAGRDAEKVWSDAASKTAENFGQSAVLLNKATDKLDEAADKLLKGTDAMKVVSESFGATMKKIVDSLKEKTKPVVEKVEKLGN